MVFLFYISASKEGIYVIVHISLRWQQFKKQE